MATRPLVDEEIRQAERLLVVLDECEFPVTTAFWLYEEEAHTWFLYLASPLVGTTNLTSLYETVDTFLEEFQIHIPLNRVKLVDPKRSEIKSVTDKVRDSGFEWEPKWYSSSSTVSHLSNEDLLVYRST